MAVGQAGGTAAAIAAKKFNGDSGQVDSRLLQTELIKQGAYIK
jgi:hypothetical protein